MGWVYRKIDQHECDKPRLYSHDRDRFQVNDIHVGDVWQCDHAECRTYWVVASDQRDGLFWSKPTSRQISDAVAASEKS